MQPSPPTLPMNAWYMGSWEDNMRRGFFLRFGDGGSFTTSGSATLYDDMTDEPIAQMGEAGPEQVTATPLLGSGRAPRAPQPALPMTNPLLLRALARGIDKRLRMTLPAGFAA